MSQSESATARHTPGPWQIKRAEVAVDGAIDYAIYDAQREVIAEAFGRTSYTNFRPAEANAHLIAAAPELYEALKVLIDMMKDQRDYQLNNAYPEEYAAVAKAEAIIAKAENRK